MSETYHCFKCNLTLAIPGHCRQCGNELIPASEMAEAYQCIMRIWERQDKAKIDVIKVNQGGPEKRV